MLDTSRNNVVQKHQKKTDKAVKVFQKAIMDLSSITSNVDDDIKAEDKIILDAKIRKDSMVAIRTKSNRMVDKINEFFELV
jgi:hypothetical protein